MASAVAQPTRAFDFQAGQNAVADNVDTDLNTLYTVLQGALGNTHVADDAAIAQSKLATTTLGYAEVTANQTGITSIVDLTGLSVTVTVPAGGRRIKITGFINIQNSTASTDSGRLYIRESSTTLQLAAVGFESATTDYTCIAVYTVVASAGAHTYKLSADSTGGGTAQMSASATQPAFIHVEVC